MRLGEDVFMHIIVLEERMIAQLVVYNYIIIKFWRNRGFSRVKLQKNRCLARSQVHVASSKRQRTLAEA